MQVTGLSLSLVCFFLGLFLFILVLCFDFVSLFLFVCFFNYLLLIPILFKSFEYPASTLYSL